MFICIWSSQDAQQHTLLMHLLLQEWTQMENSLWCASPFVVKGAPRWMVLPNGLGGMWNRCKKNEKRDMVAKLSFDVKKEKNQVQCLLIQFEILAHFLPEFHPKLNPIKRGVGKSQGGIYTRDRSNYSFPNMQRMVTPMLASVTLDQIRRYFRKSREYVNAFKDGHTGYKADKVIKDYRSHRESLKQRVGCHEQLVYLDFAKSFSMYHSIIQTPHNMDDFNTLLHMHTSHFWKYA